MSAQVSSSAGKSSSSSVEAQLDLENAPIEIIKRVNALKNIQLEILNTESKLNEELHLIECKYSTIFAPLFEKRKKVVAGEYEPSEEETKWKYEEDLLEHFKNGGASSSNGSSSSGVKGIPEFWLQTLKSAELVGEMIQEHDEPVLKHLKDVQVKLHNQKPYGYTLEFIFDDNEYFTNNVLTKTYELKTEVDAEDPLSYEGPVVEKCLGCKIDWKEGKNITLRLNKKKQKNKTDGSTRFVTQEVKQESFFNFFDTTSKPKSDATAAEESKTSKDDDDDDMSENEEDMYSIDFEVGQFFREKIIPKAVLYYTGDLIEEDYGHELGDENDDENEDVDTNDESDEQEHAQNSKKNTKKKNKHD
jgi:hypothetical protein